MFEEVAEMAVKIVTYLYSSQDHLSSFSMSVRQYDEISTIYIFSTNEITELKFQMDYSPAIGLVERSVNDQNFVVASYATTPVQLIPSRL